MPEPTIPKPNTPEQDAAAAKVADAFSVGNAGGKPSPKPNTIPQTKAAEDVSAAFNPTNRRYTTPDGVRFFSGQVSDAERAIASKSQQFVQEQANSLDEDVPGQGITSSEDNKAGSGTGSKVTVPPIRPVDTSGLQIIEDRAAALEVQRQATIASINQGFDVARNDTQGAQKRETGTTSATLARLGGYLGASGSGMGVVLNLASTHRAEMTALESKRAAAINEANSAVDDKQFQLAQMKVAEVRDIDDEIDKRAQEFFDNSSKLFEKEQKEAVKSANQISIYNKIQEGITDPQEIFGELEGAVSIEDINTFLTKSKPPTASSGAFKLSNSNWAKMLGSGLNDEEVSAVTDYIAQNGYDEELRASLNSAQRSVLDSIYRTKDKDTGKVAGFFNGTPVSSKTLQILDGFSNIDDFTTTAQEKIREELYNIGFNEEIPPTWFKETVEEEGFGDFGGQASLLPEVLQGMWDEYKNTVLGSSVGGSLEDFKGGADLETAAAPAEGGNRLGDLDES